MLIIRRLLIAIDSLPSGMGRVTWGLANSLAYKYEVHILTTNKGQFTARGVAVHLIPRYPYMTITYSTIFRSIMSKVISQISPDIIHSIIVLPWGYLFRSQKSAKIVITPSGSDVYPRKGYPTKFFLDSAFRNCNAVVINSKWLSSYVQENYQIQSVVIPTAIDTQVFRPLGDSNRQQKVVLFVGRLIKIKGVLELMKAANALPEYEFWLAGEGPLKIPAQPNVKILGFQNDIVPLYASATICTFPFHHDNFPLVGLEAMACGRAIVATEPGFSEYVENGKDGVLVKPHDVQSLINSIRFLMEDEEARKRIEQNATEKAKQYDWTAVGKRYAALYETL